jgi:transcriptional regulator with XRE-family HTH domain
MTASLGVASGTPLRVRVAEEIRVALARKRMSAARLGRELGVSQTYVWRRLKGEVAFDLDDLDRIAEILGISVASLLPTVEPTVRYAEPTKQAASPARRPPDNRPPGQPPTALGSGARRTARLPRDAVRRAA